MMECLTYYDWDFVSLQQVSTKSGVYDSYFPYLDNLYDWIKYNIPNLGYKLCLFMPWAMSIPTENEDGGTTNNEMFENIANTTESVYNNQLPRNLLLFPSGTAVQNQQNYYKLKPDGDIYTNEIFNNDDNRHCTIIGYYASTCTIFDVIAKHLIGKGLDDLTYLSSSDWGNSTIDEDLWNNSKESALNAIQNPYAKT